MCGYAYLGFTQTTYDPGLPGYSYYRCSTRYETQRIANAIREPCTNKVLRCAGVDEVVWTTVRQLLLDSDALAEELRGWLARTTAGSKGDERLQGVTSRLQELNRQRERLIDAYQAGALELDDFRTRKTGLENRILAVEQERVELQSRAMRRELAERQVEGVAGVAEALRRHLDDPSFEVKRTILRLVVEKVVVTGQRLEIHLALPVSGSFDLTSTRRCLRQLHLRSQPFARSGDLRTGDSGPQYRDVLLVRARRDRLRTR